MVASGGASGGALGLVGQAIIVASRVSAYSRAAWELLVQCAEESEEGGAAEGSEGSAEEEDSGGAAPQAPLAHYCSGLRLLVQQLILLRCQVGPCCDAAAAATAAVPCRAALHSHAALQPGAPPELASAAVNSP